MVFAASNVARQHLQGQSGRTRCSCCCYWSLFRVLWFCCPNMYMYIRTYQYVCMYVRTYVRRSVGRSACLHACLPACLPVCLSVRLHTVYTHVHASTCLVTYLSTFFLLSSRVFEERQRLRRLWMTVSGIPRSRDK